jgi:hypothetical protein
MTTDEKRKLGALEIVAEDNPSFQTKAAEVDLAIDAQVMSFFFLPSLLTRLFFVYY